MIGETGTDKTPKSFDKAQTKSAVLALLKYAVVNKKDSLFMDNPTRFLLDITAFKTPSGIHEFYNIMLPHSPYPPSSELDILLVVRDVKGHEPEHVVGQVKNELRMSKVESQVKVRQILTLKQLRDEYSTFEAKRALSKAVDLVICEQKLFKMMPRLLGREFYKKKKYHLGIPGRELVKTHDLGEQILWALKKSVIHVSLKGQTSTMVVGHDNLGEEGLVQNISKVAYWLKRKFPGGWKNIQKLSLHVGDGKGIPPLVVYFSTGSANDVRKPPITKGGSIPDPIEGELSTQPGSYIRVLGSGEIEVLERRRLTQEDKELVKALEDKPLKRKNKKSRKDKSKKKQKIKDEIKAEVKEEGEEDSEEERLVDEEEENEDQGFKEGDVEEDEKDSEGEEEQEEEQHGYDHDEDEEDESEEDEDD